ncbi:hypothetical protein [Catenulispora pinisilvae]|uniref:hypothetical protein n=1 Tax=Catenulispora pinisilvae TaxID=2705253 RepID=UPI001892042F|nr:hypothetical protein [Catenulispora pinisilvae]
MRETASRLDPDVGRLTAGGVSRGTRMRRMEWVVEAVGSAVAVALVFAGVVLFGPHHGAGTATGAAPSTPATPAAPTATANPTPTANPSPSPSPTETVTETVTETPTETPATTDAPQQLPTAQVVGALKQGLAGTGVTGFSAIVRPGEILSQITAPRGIGFLDLIIGGQQDTIAAHDTPQVLPDGSVVYTDESRGPDNGRNPDHLTVTLVRPDGTRLVAIETNAPSEKGPATPGAPMLLTAKQISTLLDSPVWDAAILAAAADAAVPATPPS